MQLTNRAAWIPASKSPLRVLPAPFPSPSSHELILHTHAIAINPVDWKIQTSDIFNLTYPAILGEDVAGVVIEVGSAVKGFRVGDRVIAHALGIGKGPAYGAFQNYVKVKTELVAKIPEGVGFEQGVVLPLSISTAAAGLYLREGLGLKYPEIGGGKGEAEALEKKKKKKEVLLLWGGSSSVGSSVIQLAVASGYEVVTTASPANYAYAKSLGAALVLDYHNPDIVSILILLLQGYNSLPVGAYDAIGNDATVRQCAAVLHALGGGKIASVGQAPQDLPEGVKVSRIGSTNILGAEDGIVAKRVWGGFVPAALEEGSLKPAPREWIAGEALEDVQGAMDLQKRGVSARKVVVTL